MEDETSTLTLGEDMELCPKCYENCMRWLIKELEKEKNKIHDIKKKNLEENKNKQSDDKKITETEWDENYEATLNDRRKIQVDLMSRVSAKSSELQNLIREIDEINEKIRISLGKMNIFEQQQKMREEQLSKIQYRIEMMEMNEKRLKQLYGHFYSSKRLLYPILKIFKYGISPDGIPFINGNRLSSSGSDKNNSDNEKNKKAQNTNENDGEHLKQNDGKNIPSNICYDEKYANVNMKNMVHFQQFGSHVTSSEINRGLNLIGLNLCLLRSLLKLNFKDVPYAIKPYTFIPQLTGSVSSERILSDSSILIDHDPGICSSEIKINLSGNNNTFPITGCCIAAPLKYCPSNFEMKKSTEKNLVYYPLFIPDSFLAGATKLSKSKTMSAFVNAFNKSLVWLTIEMGLIERALYKQCDINFTILPFEISVPYCYATEGIKECFWIKENGKKVQYAVTTEDDTHDCVVINKSLKLMLDQTRIDQTVWDNFSIAISTIVSCIDVLNKLASGL